LEFIRTTLTLILTIKPEKLRELSTRAAAIKLDSLIKQIDSATTSIPDDIGETTLIIETYKYDDFKKLLEDKYNIPKDSKYEKGRFKRYQKKKQSLIKNPKYKIVYINKGEYDNLDIKNFKYGLRTSNRIEYDPNHLVITNDGFVYPYVSTLIYYVYNRENNRVFKDIKDLSIFSKKKVAARLLLPVYSLMI
jgi:hypothetical protein